MGPYSNNCKTSCFFQVQCEQSQKRFLCFLLEFQELFVCYQNYLELAGSAERREIAATKAAEAEMDGIRFFFLLFDLVFSLWSFSSWWSWRSVNHAGTTSLFYWLSGSIWIRQHLPPPPSHPTSPPF